MLATCFKLILRKIAIEVFACGMQGKAPVANSTLNGASSDSSITKKPEFASDYLLRYAGNVSLAAFCILFRFPGLDRTLLLGLKGPSPAKFVVMICLSVRSIRIFAGSRKPNIFPQFEYTADSRIRFELTGRSEI